MGAGELMARSNTSKKPRGGRGWLLVMALGVLSLMLMGLVRVWTNIARVDTTYLINLKQAEVRERKALLAKLEVERERLLSPYELRRKALELGMHEPAAGQIRRMVAR